MDILRFGLIIITREASQVSMRNWLVFLTFALLGSSALLGGFLALSPTGPGASVRFSSSNENEEIGDDADDEGQFGPIDEDEDRDLDDADEVREDEVARARLGEFPPNHLSFSFSSDVAILITTLAG